MLYEDVWSISIGAKRRQTQNTKWVSFWMEETDGKVLGRTSRATTDFRRDRSFAEIYDKRAAT